MQPMRRRVSVDTPKQRLFNLLALAYISHVGDDKECVKAECKSVELLNVAKEMNLTTTRDGLIIFSPAVTFTEETLNELQKRRAQLQQLKDAIKETSPTKSIEEIESAHRQYMQLLHRYNETKDVGQALLGRLAQLSGCTTKDLYPQYGLSLDE